MCGISGTRRLFLELFGMSIQDDWDENDMKVISI